MSIRWAARTDKNQRGVLSWHRGSREPCCAQPAPCPGVCLSWASASKASHYTQEGSENWPAKWVLSITQVCTMLTNTAGNQQLCQVTQSLLSHVHWPPWLWSTREQEDKDTSTWQAQNIVFSSECKIVALLSNGRNENLKKKFLL